MGGVAAAASLFVSSSNSIQIVRRHCCLPSNRLGQIEESIIEAAVKLDVAVGVGGGTTDIRWLPSLESLP